MLLHVVQGGTNKIRFDIHYGLKCKTQISYLETFIEYDVIFIITSVQFKEYFMFFSPLTKTFKRNAHSLKLTSFRSYGERRQFLDLNEKKAKLQIVENMLQFRGKNIQTILPKQQLAGKTHVPILIFCLDFYFKITKCDKRHCFP